MVTAEVLELLKCKVYDGELTIKDDKGNVQHYSNTSLLYSDEAFLKTYDLSNKNPEHIFLYYNLLDFITDYQKKSEKKYQNSIVVICTTNSLSEFLDQINYNEWVKIETVKIYYPNPIDFNFNALWFFLTLNSKDSFIVKENGSKYTVIKNDKLIYSFSPDTYSFKNLRFNLKLDKRSKYVLPFYKNDIRSNNFIIY